MYYYKNMDNKILILLFYYNRPNLVKTALASIKNHNYHNWELAFIDDGSEIEGKPIVEEILSESLSNIKFYNTYDSIENKLQRNQEEGSIFGKYAQQAIEESNADIALMLCDDDALYPNYLINLNTYFNNHPEENYVYSHIHPFDPILTRIEDNPPYEHHHLNKEYPLNPYYNIDMSQVSWRIKPFLDNNIKFRYPMTVDLDANLYDQMHNKFGDCKFSGFFSQYKSICKGGYNDQLSYRMGKRLANLNRPEDIYKITIK
jgi:glycosyltransferase involved in cell wall biosynthesis